MSFSLHWAGILSLSLSVPISLPRQVSQFVCPLPEPLAWKPFSSLFSFCFSLTFALSVTLKIQSLLRYKPACTYILIFFMSLISSHVIQFLARSFRWLLFPPNCHSSFNCHLPQLPCLLDASLWSSQAALCHFHSAHTALAKVSSDLFSL